VTIPELGTVKLLARSCGTVYRTKLSDGKPELRRMDANGMEPTADMAKKSRKPREQTHRGASLGAVVN
jgi:hypothetical protein